MYSEGEDKRLENIRKRVQRQPHVLPEKKGTGKNIRHVKLRSTEQAEERRSVEEINQGSIKAPWVIHICQLTIRLFLVTGHSCGSNCRAAVRKLHIGQASPKLTRLKSKSNKAFYWRE
jgi:hypothetical protein